MEDFLISFVVVAEAGFVHISLGDEGL